MIKRTSYFIKFFLIAIYFVVLFLQGLLYSQSKDPDKILEKVKENFSKVNDYQVNVHIKVDVDFLKIPESDAVVFFKQPDKIHVESEKFALLPKRGLNFSPVSILNEKYTAIYVEEDTIDNILASVVKVIPLNSDADIVLSTLWIDTKRNIVLKIESSAKPSGTFTLKFSYGEKHSGFYLPDSLIFSFVIDKLRFRGGFDETLDADEKEIKEKDSRAAGKVYLIYSNYKINQGIPDSFFDKE